MPERVADALFALTTFHLPELFFHFVTTRPSWPILAPLFLIPVCFLWKLSLLINYIFCLYFSVFPRSGSLRPKNFTSSINMANNTFPAMTPAQNFVIDTSSLSASSSSSVWDRISNWVSENKAVVYTVAGIAVVVTGGTVFYLSSTPEPSAPKKSKNQRRKEKKKAEEEKKVQQEKPAAEGKFGGWPFFLRSVHLTPLTDKKARVEEPEELPEVDETTVDSLSEEVRVTSRLIGGCSC